MPVRGGGSGHPKRQYQARSSDTSSRPGQGRGQELLSKQQAPEIAYRTVTSVHLLILDASVQLMEKCVKLATSQIITPDPELARRKQSVNCKLNGVKNITFSRWQTLAMKLHGECLSSWMRQITRQATRQTREQMCPSNLCRPTTTCHQSLLYRKQPQCCVVQVEL